MERKVCSMCGIEKDINEFGKASNSKDGYSSHCKECAKIINKKSYMKNREVIREKRKKYYHQDVEKFRNDRKDYYYNHQEKEKENRKKWNEINWLKINIHGCYLRSKNKNIPCDSEEDLYKYLKPIADNLECEICHKALCPGGSQRHDSPTIDRIIPANGYIISNVAILCHDCNRRKSDSNIEQLIQIINWYKMKLNFI